MTSAEMIAQCAVGCHVFSNGDVRHIKTCKNYPESLSELIDKIQSHSLVPEFVHIVLNNDRNVDDCIEGVFMYPDDAENEIESLNNQQVCPDSLSIKTVRIQRKRIEE